MLSYLTKDGIRQTYFHAMAKGNGKFSMKSRREALGVLKSFYNVKLLATRDFPSLTEESYECWLKTKKQKD
jgi:hypothetical protein